jgi:hypothetical protein
LSGALSASAIKQSRTGQRLMSTRSFSRTLVTTSGGATSANSTRRAFQSRFLTWSYTLEATRSLRGGVRGARGRPADLRSARRGARHLGRICGLLRFGCVASRALRALAARHGPRNPSERRNTVNSTEARDWVAGGLARRRRRERQPVARLRLHRRTCEQQREELVATPQIVQVAVERAAGLP